MTGPVVWLGDADAETGRTLVRGDKVRHRSPEIVGATRGVVVGVLTDFEHQPFAVVQWAGESMTVTYLYLLERTSFPNPKHGKAKPAC